MPGVSCDDDVDDTAAPSWGRQFAGAMRSIAIGFGVMILALMAIVHHAEYRLSDCAGCH